MAGTPMEGACPGGGVQRKGREAAFLLPACNVTGWIDPLVHQAEGIDIAAENHGRKDATERAARKAVTRRSWKRRAAG